MWLRRGLSRQRVQPWLTVDRCSWHVSGIGPPSTCGAVRGDFFFLFFFGFDTQAKWLRAKNGTSPVLERLWKITAHRRPGEKNPPSDHGSIGLKGGAQPSFLLSDPGTHEWSNITVQPVFPWTAQKRHATHCQMEKDNRANSRSTLVIARATAKSTV